MVLKNGVVLGVGLGVYDEESYRPLFGSEQVNSSQKAMLTLDIGYKF
jgi:hypothetical protein